MLTFVASPPGRPDPAATSTAGEVLTAMSGGMNLEWLLFPASTFLGSPRPVDTALTASCLSRSCPPSPEACTTAQLLADTDTVPLAALPRCWFPICISPFDVTVGQAQGFREMARSV